MRLSGEFTYADGTARGAQNANGEYGENPASDFANNDISKVWYHANLTGSALFAATADGEAISHVIYDPWGKPLTETAADMNYTGMEGVNNYTGYSWDETLGLYYAQNRFYDAENHRFTQSDPVEDGTNWYVYCENSPVCLIDFLGLVAGDLYINNVYIDNIQSFNEKNMRLLELWHLRLGSQLEI